MTAVVPGVTLLTSNSMRSTAHEHIALPFTGVAMTPGRTAPHVRQGILATVAVVPVWTGHDTMQRPWLRIVSGACS